MKRSTTASSPKALSHTRRGGSPMATMPTNTSTSAAAAGGKRDTQMRPRSPSGSPLPHIELDATTVALIKENEQMVQTIVVLQHELDKQKVRLSDAEEARVALAREVAELRSALGLATSEASSSTGKVLNYKTAYLNIQDAYDKLKEDAEATKNKLEEATQRERLLMQSTSATARTQSQRRESMDLVTHAMRMPNTFLATIQAIAAKLSDPAVRPADRRRRVLADVERLEVSVAGYKPAEKAASVDGVDVPIRQCIYGYLLVILKLLKEVDRA